MKFIRSYIDLCLFKASPADLPASQWLLRLTLFAYFIIGTGIGLIDSPIRISVASSLADTLTMVVALWLMLNFRGMLNRYQQSLTALTGAGCCIGIVAIPIMLLFSQVDVKQQMTSYVMLLMIALMFWSLMVTAHILRKSLDIKPGTAAVLTVAYTIITLVLVALANSGVA
ncbi:MAG: hypothetical protein P1P93_07245 [Gammaproteobacteria bacterium]|nr:hypothetical protein [Gammaproteobacteria bacterium]MDT8371889.1 hypothetical protein [Gammaproteobacteria bacterium]